MESIGASELQLQIRRGSKIGNENLKRDDAFNEVIASCQSLSHYETKSFKSAIPQINASILAASLHITAGIALSFSAVLIPQLESPDSDIPHVSKELTSLAASIITLMGPIGSIFSGYVMDSIGRVNTLKASAIPSVIGIALIAAAPNIYFILVGRVVAGIAIALATSPAFVYITEVARSDLRGSLIATAPTLASLGMVLALVGGALVHWRIIAWISLAFTLVPIALIWIYVPESPVYLVSKGRIEDAAKSLKYLYSKYPQPENSIETLADMHLRVLIRDQEKTTKENNEKVDKNGKRQSDFVRKCSGFLKPTGYKPLIILFFLFVIQQFSGIYIMLFFSVTFLQDIGSGGIDPFLASIFIGVVRLVMSGLNTYLLQKFKRRFLVMLSTSLMAICMFTSGATTYWIQQGATNLDWAPIVLISLFVCASMLGLLMIPWTMTAELFPTDIRSTGHTLSISMASIVMFGAVQSYRTLLDVLGGAHVVQWFFACVAILGFFYGLCILPETHGKELSEIQAYFEKKTPTRNRVIASDVHSVTANGTLEAEQMLRNKETA